MNKKMEGYFLAFLSSLFVGAAFIFNTLALTTASPLQGPLFVFLTGFILSLFFVIQQKKTKELWKIYKKHKIPMAIMGILNAIFSILWFHSLDIIGPSLLGFMLRFATLFIITLSVVFLKEKFTFLEAVGGVIIIFGAFIISFTQETALIYG